MSDLAMANVKALASGERGSFNCCGIVLIVEFVM